MAVDTRGKIILLSPGISLDKTILVGYIYIQQVNDATNHHHTRRATMTNTKGRYTIYKIKKMYAVKRATYRKNTQIRLITEEN